MPTIGYDLEPILRHCYHARHLWLLQNALVSAILLVGFFAATWSTVLLAGIAFLANFLSPPAERADRSTAYLVLGGLALQRLKGQGSSYLGGSGSRVMPVLAKKPARRSVCC
ncbi:hypothetical protein F6X54_29905 [Micromonospora aurantiaca]|uniref:Uncharacterized protein n=1 Tax=Micromonospora aurantiaca (nom. illeg.) TaxID=47850 RepID=A0ABQ6U8P3_9ACTN|nr:hypothetical protein [Micromonospora aurantiaca]KAB1102986.1 hypothetical protein F6X54_29905 [Micromonospora aurantiaca]